MFLTHCQCNNDLSYKFSNLLSRGVCNSCLASTRSPNGIYPILNLLVLGQGPDTPRYDLELKSGPRGLVLERINLHHVGRFGVRAGVPSPGRAHRHGPNRPAAKPHHSLAGTVPTAGMRGRHQTADRVNMPAATRAAPVLHTRGRRMLRTHRRRPVRTRMPNVRASQGPPAFPSSVLCRPMECRMVRIARSRCIEPVTANNNYTE